MNFEALYEIAMTIIWQNAAFGKSIEHDCESVRIQSNRNDHFQAISFKPLKDFEEPLTPSTPFYTMLFQYDCCYICGKQLLPLDLDEQWYKIHPDIPASDWTRYSR